MVTGTVKLVLSAQPTKFGSQPQWHVAAQAYKTGTVWAVLHARKVKTGTQPPELADAQLAKTGTELLVFHVSVEDNGTPSQETVHVPPETGTDFHVFNAPLDKDGTHHLSRAHAPITPSGTVSHAWPAQVETDTGIINLTIVSVEPATGTELNVLFAHPALTGMERLASLVLVEDFGIHWTWFVNVQMILNGMVPPVLKPAQMERFFKTVSVFVHKANSNKTENVWTTQFVKMEPNGMVKHALEFHATQVLHSPVDVNVVKPQSTPAQLAPIGTVTDAFTSPTSAQQVWFGRITVARATQPNVQVTLMNSMASVSHSQASVNQVWPGTTPTAAPLSATLAQAELTSTVLSVFHINLVTREEFGMILSVNVFAHPAPSGMP